MTTNTTQESAVTMIDVRTVEQTIAEGSKTEQVLVSRRSTEKNPVPNEHRERSIVIPELTVDSVPSKFQSIVLAALRATAVSQLKDITDQDINIKQVPAAIWNVDSLLLYAAKKSESTRLTKENIGAWFDATKLATYIMTEKKDAKMLAAWRDRACKLAATVLDFSDAQCTTMLATFGKFEDDVDNLIGKQIVKKLAKRQADLAAQLAEVELEAIE